ncbi:hypothetical protein BD410DRAFT_792990 [Rickenella mellea]|uniref:Uncharacterized protein n=1 Tax=Rickenella mellea TaxID=50990 RepID=A0A4Y7PTA2_9AGAM|nr:hypothetical protein BD410DRAFT_792990 [Rickenella mellea]
MFTSISNPLTVILITRLVLNLRQVSHSQEGYPPTLGAIGTIQEPAFAINSILGNLGAPLRVGPGDDDVIEEMGSVDVRQVAEERGMAEDSEIIEEPRYSSDV